MIPGLYALPTPANVTATVTLPIVAPPNADSCSIGSRPQQVRPFPTAGHAPGANTAFLKQLMPSYQAAFPFERPRTASR